MHINITSIGGIGSTYLSEQIERSFQGEENFSLVHGHLLHALKREAKEEQKIIYLYGNCLESFISRLRRNIFLRAWINFFRPLGSLNPNVCEHFNTIESFQERQLSIPSRTVQNIRCFNHIISRSVELKQDLCSITKHFDTAKKFCKNKPNVLFLHFNDPQIKEKLSTFLQRDVNFEIKPRNSNLDVLNWFPDINKQKTVEFYSLIDNLIIRQIEAI